MVFGKLFGKRYSNWDSLPLKPGSLKKLREYDNGKAAPVFVLHDGHPSDAHAIARFFARAFGMQLVVIKLPALLNTCLRNADREINRLFSQPQNMNSVLFIDEADALLMLGGVSEEKAAYLLARITAHRAPVFLASQSLLAESFSPPGLRSEVIRLDRASGEAELYQAC